MKRTVFFSFVDAPHISTLYFMRKMGGILYTTPWCPASLALLTQADGDKLRVFTAGSHCPWPRNCAVAWSDKAGWERAGCKVPSETRGLQWMEATETVNNVPGATQLNLWVYHWVWKWKPSFQSNFDYNNFKKSLAASTSLKIIQLLASVAVFLLFLPLWLLHWLQNLHVESQLAF